MRVKAERSVDLRENARLTIDSLILGRLTFPILLGSFLHPIHPFLRCPDK